MKRAAVLSLTLMCLVPLAAWCQEVQSSHKTAAQELVRMTEAEKSSSEAVKAMANAMIEQQPMMEPYRDIFLKWAEKTLSWERMEPRMTELYMQAFTEPELRELIAFYKTPIGRKTLEKMPLLMQGGMKIGMELAQERQGELERMITARMEEMDGTGSDSDEEDEEDDAEPPVR